MQLTFIGDFNNGTNSPEGFGSKPDEKIPGTNVEFFQHYHEAIDQFVAGLKPDLVICSSRIEIDKLQGELRRQNINIGALVQADPNDQAGLMVGFRLDDGERSKHRPDDTSSWLGDETNPMRVGQCLADVERSLILQTLIHCGGNRTYAADILGISSRTLRNKLQQYSAKGCTITSPRLRQSPETGRSPVAVVS